MELRDRGVVRQQWDTSCGLAALATILSYHYGDRVAERELLDDLVDPALRTGRLAPRAPADGGVSFLDISRLARRRGYRAVGLEIDYRDLQRLSVPVIVALKVAGRPHFSVLRAAGASGAVLLADPSWGNRRLSMSDFRRLFLRPGQGSRGRILLVLPAHRELRTTVAAEQALPARPALRRPLATRSLEPAPKNHFEDAGRVFMYPPGLMRPATVPDRQPP